MTTKDPVAFLETVQRADGVSGREKPVSEIVLRELGPLVDEIRQDDLGNTYLLRRGRQPGAATLMIAAHIDEIGFLVQSVDARGFVRIRPVGGVDPRLLLAQEVWITASGYPGKPRTPGEERTDRRIPGVIGVKPPHLLHADEREKSIPIEELFVDTGLPPEDAADWIRIGDTVALQAPLLHLKGGRVTGKALDNRAGVAALAAVLDALEGERPAVDLMLVATVQEEVGLHGARTSAFQVQPDAGIAVDVGFGSQPGVGADESFPLGGGPVLARGPNTHPELLRHLLETARAEQIPFQEEVLAESGGTDAGAIQVAGAGIPTALLSIPLRYMHSPVETVDTEDIRNTGRLLASLARRLDPAAVRGWRTWQG